jgi:excisionase family DNA binding protein
MVVLTSSPAIRTHTRRASVTSFIGVSDDFLDALAARVKEAVVEHLHRPSYWMAVDQAATYLAMTVPAIRARVKRGEIPHHRVEGRILFERGELDQWVRGES